MRLNPDQQQALLHLQRVQLRCDEAAVEREHQMSRCWQLGVPATRIAQAANVSKTLVTRRFAAIHAQVGS